MKKMKTDETRRKFLVRLALGLTGFSALAAGLPVLASLFAPLLEKAPDLWRPVADVQGFAIGDVKLVRFENANPEAWSGKTAHTAAWLKREEEASFVAFSANCTHLGCPIRWEAQARLFMCPCHGGVYYPDGTVAAGPPPKPLTRYPVRVRNGKIEIRTSPLPITTIGA